MTSSPLNGSPEAMQMESVDSARFGSVHLAMTHSEQKAAEASFEAIETKQCIELNAKWDMLSQHGR